MDRYANTYSSGARTERSRLHARRAQLQAEIRRLEVYVFESHPTLSQFLLPCRPPWQGLVLGGVLWFVMTLLLAAAFFLPPLYAWGVASAVVIGFVCSRFYIAYELCLFDGWELLVHAFCMVLLFPVLWIIRLLQARICYIKQVQWKRLECLERDLSLVMDKLGQTGSSSYRECAKPSPSGSSLTLWWD